MVVVIVVVTVLVVCLYRLEQILGQLSDCKQSAFFSLSTRLFTVTLTVMK